MNTVLTLKATANLQQNTSVVIDPSIRIADYAPIDLSSTTLSKIGNDFDMKEYLRQQRVQTKARVLYGGYLENRMLYDDKERFTSIRNEARTIHLGVDFWCSEHTSVHAVYEGYIHSYHNNLGYGNYGATILIQHAYKNMYWYSLYGHLSLDSLKDKIVGNQVATGEQIGFLGEKEENGGYEPHLHFQLIHNLQAYVGDYPGVSSKSDLEFYKQNCPDPLSILPL